MNTQSDNIEKIQLETNAIILRYIIPFKYVGNGTHNVYKEVYRNLSNSLKWHQQMRLASGSDCYRHMQKLYGMNNHSEELENGIATIWKAHKEKVTKTDINGNQYQKFELSIPLYEGKRVRGSQNAEIRPIAEIQDFGLILLKNENGLFWFEIKIISNNIALEELIKFQNLFRSIDLRSWGYQNYVENKEAKQKEIFYYIDEGEKQTAVGHWISQILESTKDISLEIEYYSKAQYRLKTASGVEKSIEIPKRAHVFSYVAAAKILRPELEKLTYHMACGFDFTYKMSETALERMFSPFENERWYVEKEGCSICAVYEEVNKKVYAQQKLKRVREDYFLMYIHQLQQSYALFDMLEEVADSVPAGREEYYMTDAGFRKRLEELERKVNLFLMKNSYSSVSFIGHQNQFYNYVGECLGICEDVEALKSGMDSIEELLRRKSDEKISTSLSVFTIVGFCAIFKDIEDIVPIFVSDGNLQGIYKQYSYWTVGIIMVFVLFGMRETLWIFVKNIGYDFINMGRTVVKVLGKMFKNR